MPILLPLVVVAVIFVMGGAWFGQRWATPENKEPGTVESLERSESAFILTSIQKEQEETATTRNLNQTLTYPAVDMDETLLVSQVGGMAKVLFWIARWPTWALPHDSRY